MLNTLIRDTLIDLATKRYGRVTMVLSELAKPGVWKDKLMIASEKLYDDDYKYIYLKAVVEVLSELDEEWGRYAREVYLVEQRLQKVFSSCSKKYPSTSDAELMENLTVLANLSPVDYEGDCTTSMRKEDIERGLNVVGRLLKEVEAYAGNSG